MSKMDKIQYLTTVTMLACLLLCPTGFLFQTEKILFVIGFLGAILSMFLLLILFVIEIITDDD